MELIDFVDNATPDELRRHLVDAMLRIVELEEAVKYAIKRACDDEAQLIRIANALGKDARHSKDGTIAGLVDDLVFRKGK